MLWGWGRLLGSALGGTLGVLCRPPGAHKVAAHVALQREPPLPAAAASSHRISDHSPPPLWHRGVQLGALLGLAIHLARIKGALVSGFHQAERNPTPSVAASSGLWTIGAHQCRQNALPSPNSSVKEVGSTRGWLPKEASRIRDESGFLSFDDLIPDPDDVCREEGKVTFSERRPATDRLSEAEMDLLKAVDRMEAAADTHLAVDLIVAGDRRGGMELLSKAADLGHPEALFNLGVLLEEEGRPEEALRRYEAAARLGYAPALFNLAVMDHRQSLKKAVSLYERAAALGLPEAKEALRVLDCDICLRAVTGPQ